MYMGPTNVERKILYIGLVNSDQFMTQIGAHPSAMDRIDMIEMTIHEYD